MEPTKITSPAFCQWNRKFDSKNHLESHSKAWCGHPWNWILCRWTWNKGDFSPCSSLHNIFSKISLSFETSGGATSSSITSQLASSSSPLGFSFFSPPHHILQGKSGKPKIFEQTLTMQFFHFFNYYWFWSHKTKRKQVSTACSIVFIFIIAWKCKNVLSLIKSSTNVSEQSSSCPAFCCW